MESLSGTIVFSTVGRSEYGFDIFSVPLTNVSAATEHRLTDGISINFNGQFVDDNQNLVFISERTGSPMIYLTQPNTVELQQLPSAPDCLFHDRPILHNNQLFFISAHQPPSSLYKSWSALYSTSIILDHNHNHNQIARLTPVDSADFSPSISPSGKFIAVASYGSKPWGGEFHELNTHIVVFPLSDPSQRTVLAERGGWPTWSGDSTLYFHRQSDDGWWSIYQVEFPATTPPRRVTPPGLHAFTPAALQDGKRIAIATRRKDRVHRHIEIFDTQSGEFEPVTELINPELHHYNPFVSPSSKFLGYHRFRGILSSGDKLIPNLEPIFSPIKALRMLRINGQFPAFSSNGDLIAYNHDFENNGRLMIMKSDGSKRWTLIKGQIAFYNSWAPSPSDSNKHVIFTSLGSIFQAPGVSVQVARITFEFDTSCIKDIEVKIMTKQETGNNGFPACSPDGKSVVFRSGRSGHKNLYIMDAVDGEDKDEIRQITEGAWTDTMPSWSPDGKWIVFSSNRHDPRNPVTFGIYLVRPDGTEVKRVHIEGSSDEEMERINHVCFSPNGEWLLFTTNMGGVSAEPVSFPNQFQPYGELYIVKVDGRGLKRLTWNGYENGTPAWHWHTASTGLDVELRNLSLNGKPVDVDVDVDVDCDADFDQLNGRFQEPLWITPGL